MKVSYAARAFCLMMLLLCSFLSRAGAQEKPSTFNLPDARSGQSYQANIEEVLRSGYGLRLDAGNPNMSLQWAFAGGEFPIGLTLLADGTIVGAPQSELEQVYRFRLKVVEASSRAGQLTIDFTLAVKSAGLRLTKITGARLVPIAANTSETDGVVSSVTSQADNARRSPIDVSITNRSIGGSTTPADRDQLSWGVPNTANGGTVDNINQSEYSVGVKVDPALRACILGSVVMKTKNGKDYELVGTQSKKIEPGESAQNFDLKLAVGKNHIVVTAYAKKAGSEGSCDPTADLNTFDALDGTLELTVECVGNKCGKAAKSQEPDSTLSSKTMRAILGIEQSGASSASSAQNPFVDFFFSAPLSTNHLLTWGNVRLTSTPQQVSAFASSASNLVGAATGDKINDLATSFDFTIGPEYQFNPRANTRFSLIAGFGATSTLTGPPKIAPIFKIPTAASTQYASFVSQYPEATTPGATHIAFVPQEQDRFFRHYFAGIRVKSYHGEKFPSMFDVTFGQNSAVTEGKLRHFVLGFEGSHHFPIMKNSIYIFGSASLKIGGPKFRSTPFILDPADTTVKLSDPTVVITSRQSNRDFYRIGFGIDLIDLFKGDKKKEQ